MVKLSHFMATARAQWVLVHESESLINPEIVGRFDTKAEMLSKIDSIIHDSVKAENFKQAARLIEQRADIRFKLRMA